MKIFKSYGSLLNNKEGIGFEFSKYNLISMCPNIPNDNGNFFHRMLEEFTIRFIIFISTYSNCQERKLPSKNRGVRQLYLIRSQIPCTKAHDLKI